MLSVGDEVSKQNHAQTASQKARRYWVSESC
jgi:hypothetical protein